MIIVDEPAFMGRKSGGNNPVMDGLALWFDGRDGIEGVDLNTNVHSGVMRDRITGEAITFSGNSQAPYVRCDGNKYTFESRGVNGANVEGKLQNGARSNLYTHEIVYSKLHSDTRQSYFGVFLDWYSGSSTRFFSPTGTNTQSHSASGFSLYEPWHILLTYGDGFVTWYKNGDLVASKAYTDPVSPVFGNFIFKLMSIVPSDSVINDLYSYKAYNRILTPDEIAFNYNYEKSLGRVQ